MPTYDYQCNKCGKEFEFFQSIKDEPLKVCPACGKPALKRKISAGAGLIFKGTGFYLTDYKNKSSSHSETSNKTNKDKSTTTKNSNKTPKSGKQKKE
ncbi:MAG: FmdB family zinc ribbon protein [Ignavibacteria bacterium]